MNKKQVIHIRVQEPTPLNVAQKYAIMSTWLLLRVSEKHMVKTQGKDGVLYIFPLFYSVSLESAHLGFKHKKFEVGKVIVNHELKVIKATTREQIHRNIRKEVKKFYKDIIKDIQNLLKEVDESGV